MKKTLVVSIIMFAIMAAGAEAARAADWSVTELQYQRGRLETPSFIRTGKSGTTSLTFQHASGWKYGDTFFFFDYITDNTKDGFNDDDIYGEIYLNFSLGKISGKKVGGGPLKDIGLLMGMNEDADANVRKWLPGLRFSWDVPGFAFFNTDLTAYMDASSGVASGGAPKEDNSFMIDFNWSYPVSSRFGIEGHMEYIGSRTNEFGGDVDAWILAQPQFRYDLGAELFQAPEQLYLGVEWQFWLNKLGDGATDESALQTLLVWRL